MNSEWSLDILYKGYDDPAFLEDRKKLVTLINQYQDLMPTLKSMKPLEGLTKLFKTQESIAVLSGKLTTYTSLRSEANTTDTKTAAILGQLEELLSNTSKTDAAAVKYVASIPDVLTLIKKDEFLSGYEFLIKTYLENASHTLSDEVEEVISKMNLSAGAAWSKMQSYLTSIVEADDQGEKMNLSSVRNLAYSPDAKVRKDAYDAELGCYEKINDAISYSLNNIKSQVNTVAELRGYTSPLDMTLSLSKMSKATLDAMLTAMKEYLPKFHEYLHRKGEMLGSSNGLAWYDMFAPMGDSHMKFTVEEAKDFLVQLFHGFSDDLADLVEEAFDHSWIDFYPRSGKVGGAFCCNMPFVKESRILTNFDGNLGSVVTLAHELGHAYHGLHIQDHKPLNTEYSMPVAETASTFNETVVMNAVIANAEGKEKLALIESQLQDVTQIICDIYSRYLFEKTVFERRKDEFMFSDDLCKIMLDAQKEAYGSGLDASTLNPYMWICKSHYYSEQLSYYNFPYAFGGLFARGLYALYEQQGPDFISKYQALLHATTVSTVEEVAMMADIDLTTPEFWRTSLKSVADQIDEFIRLSKEC